MESSPFVEFVEASFRLPNGRLILDRLSLSVAAGETLAFIGRSGSGKTTALRLVNALAMPTGGTVRVSGKSTTDWNPIELRRQTGYVIQDVGLFPHLSVAENVAVVPTLQRWDTARVQARVEEMLALVGLPASEYGGRRPHELSGGQRQRIGVARALAADPPLVLLDEPFGALDPITRLELQHEFRKLQQRLGKAAIFVTHDLAEAARVGDRIALLAGGRLLAAGTPDELRASREPEVHAFLEAGSA